jgi:hypothetical protein
LETQSQKLHVICNKKTWGVLPPHADGAALHCIYWNPEFEDLTLFRVDDLSVLSNGLTEDKPILLAVYDLEVYHKNTSFLFLAYRASVSCSPTCKKKTQ